MRIAYLATRDLNAAGGIEKYTMEVGTRLAARGHEITVYTLGTSQVRAGTLGGIRVRAVPFFAGRSIEKLSAVAAATAIELATGNAEIVHYHAFGVAMFSVVPRLFGRRVVVQGHGLEWMRTKWDRGGRLFLRASEVPSIMAPHAITVVSRVMQRYVAERYHRDATYIPTGVNQPTLHAPELIQQYGLRGGDYFLFAGRLVREKGAHYLIEAFRRAGGAAARLKLVVAGDANYEEAYKAELRALAADDPRILFPGMVRGQLLSELMTNTLCFVLPSDLEGLSTVLFEAMSYGAPCLASDIPENIEALSGLGHSFKAGDVASLTGQLEVLAADAAHRNRFRDAAQRHVATEHSWDRIAVQLEALYQQMLVDGIETTGV